MARHTITALDVGSFQVRTVVAERRKGDSALRIAGIGVVPSAGVRRGVVVDLEDAVSAIRQSVSEAERVSNTSIRSVCLAVGGHQISVASSRGVVAVSRADGEISPEDVRRAIHAAESFIPKNPNREILHMIPRDFKVDQEAGVKNPVGMHGIRLEVDTLIIECATPALKNLLKCVEGAGLQVQEYRFSPLAAGEALLSKRQKELGVMLLDIGGGTSSFAIWEEGVPIHAGVIPIGGGHVTNDIAIGFRTQTDIAEEVKRKYGACMPDELSKRDTVRLNEFLGGEEAAGKVAEAGTYARRELAEIIEARLKDIFELLHKELKRIERVQLLPGGVVLTGGTSLMPDIVEFTKRELKLPAERGVLPEGIGFDPNASASLAPVVGLLGGAGGTTSETLGSWKQSAGRSTPSSWYRWVKSLLP